MCRTHILWLITRILCKRGQDREVMCDLYQLLHVLPSGTLLSAVVTLCFPTIQKPANILNNVEK